MALFGWLNDQLLKMEWLWSLVAQLVERIFGLDVGSRLGGSIHFFIYDSIKILLLLSALIFGISYIQSFFPPERMRRILGRFNGITANILGALLGTVTPFCSCSSIPCSLVLPMLDCLWASRSVPDFLATGGSCLVDPTGEHLRLGNCDCACSCRHCSRCRGRDHHRQFQVGEIRRAIRVQQYTGLN